jgi:hypothetical protein
VRYNEKNLPTEKKTTQQGSRIQKKNEDQIRQKYSGEQTQKGQSEIVRIVFWCWAASRVFRGKP